MQTHSINHNESFNINSFMYTHDSSSLEYVSPKDYQKKASSFQPCLGRVNNKKVTKSKKIILGKPIDGKKQKMSLQELKALSRQIRPHHHCDLNSRPDIIAISRNLRENLARAKSKMMDSLKKSSTPKDLQIYEYLNKEDLSSSSSVPSSPNLSSSSSSSDYEDDDYSSVNSTNSSIQLRLVTNDAGSASVVPTSSFSSSLSTTTTTTTDTSTTCSSFDISDDAMIFGNPLPLYTPDFYTSPSIMNMDLFFQSPHWAKTMPCSNSDVTEDQIDSWLQRGGFGDNMSPITMATDQELADLLDFDM